MLSQFDENIMDDLDKAEDSAEDWEDSAEDSAEDRDVMLSQFDENIMDPVEFSNLLSILVKKAEVATLTEISKALADELGKDNSESLRKTIDKYMRYSEDVTDPNLKACTDIKTQKAILRYLKEEMIDTEWKLADKYADYRDYYEKIIEWLPQWKRDNEVRQLLGIVRSSSDFSKLLDNISKNFEKMTKYEKGLILKYFFSINLTTDDVELINYVYNMSPELLSEGSASFGIDVVLWWLHKNEIHEHDMDLDNVGVYMNLAFRSDSPYAFAEPKTDDQLKAMFKKQLKKQLKNSTTGQCMYFEEMVPVFLKMTRDKWFFLAQCKFYGLYSVQSVRSYLMDEPDSQEF
ncbi:MAG: hypothetical protein K6E32_05660 [Lachnospiraceae bacterium]|nr:hypothetical protein [Lachnospiraceae bacterium]